jgi:hypothetical protein
VGSGRTSSAPTTQTPAAALRSGLNTLLAEHVSLAAAATGAALAGRTEEFKAAADALNGPGASNSTDLVKSVGSAYGPEVEKAFDPLWRKHIGFVVDYTTAVAAKDAAKASKSVEDLKAYAGEVGTVFNSINGLPKEAVSQLVLTHILTLKDVIDAQAAKNLPRAYTALRTAFAHQHMLGDPLAEATVKKFPSRFV